MSFEELSTRNNNEEGILRRFYEGCLRFRVVIWIKVGAFGDGDNGVLGNS